MLGVSPYHHVSAPIPSAELGSKENFVALSKLFQPVQSRAQAGAKEDYERSGILQRMRAYHFVISFSLSL